MSEEERTEILKLANNSFGWPFWILIIVVVGLFVGLTQPNYPKHKKRPDQTEAIINLRQIGLALHDFENEYGEYPNENTVALITKKHPKHGKDLSGKSSNALFRQLFTAGVARSEAMFYAKIPGVRKPDGDTAPGKLLEKGEVGFAYIVGLSPDGNPTRPIAFAPIIPGTKKFDPKPFDGRAVVLRMDNSVTSVNIGKDGQALLGGADMLSPEHPVWNGQAPDIRYPE